MIQTVSTNAAGARNRARPSHTGRTCPVRRRRVEPPRPAAPPRSLRQSIATCPSCTPRSLPSRAGSGSRRRSSDCVGTSGRSPIRPGRWSRRTTPAAASDMSNTTAFARADRLLVRPVDRVRKDARVQVVVARARSRRAWPTPRLRGAVARNFTNASIAGLSRNVTNRSPEISTAPASAAGRDRAGTGRR